MTTRFPAIPTPRPDDIESIARALLACKQTLDMLLAAPYTDDTVVQAGTLADLITKLGIKGAQGIQGKRGYVGPPGGDGEDGVQGVQGKRGFVGKRGYLGQRGEDGEDGLQGLQGRRGTPGQRGLRGHTGDDGAEGEPGVTIPGKRGARGLRGFLGAPGADGDEAAFQPGQRGRDGGSIDFGMQVNGSMIVSQENAANTVTLVNNAVSKYVVDCWLADYNHGAATAGVQSFQFPAVNLNFSQSLYLYTPTNPFTGVANGDYARVFTRVEGYRVAKLAWGTADAISMTIAAWVYSSRGGVNMIRITNADGTRTYHAEVTLAIGNNWVVVVIPPDTNVTWQKTTGTGISVVFNAVGKDASPVVPFVWGGAGFHAQSTNSVSSQLTTAGDFFQVTGLKMFPGVADARTLYLARIGALERDFMEELFLCKRYYETSFAYGTVPADNVAQNNGIGFTYSTTRLEPMIIFSSVKRAAPTITYYSSTVKASPTAGQWQYFDPVSVSWKDGTGMTSIDISTFHFFPDFAGTWTTTSVISVSGGWVADARL